MLVEVIPTSPALLGSKYGWTSFNPLRQFTCQDCPVVLRTRHRTKKLCKTCAKARAKKHSLALAAKRKLLKMDTRKVAA